jgi:hypothetical protein
MFTLRFPLLAWCVRNIWISFIMLQRSFEKVCFQFEGTVLAFIPKFQNCVPVGHHIMIAKSETGLPYHLTLPA